MHALGLMESEATPVERHMAGEVVQAAKSQTEHKGRNIAVVAPEKPGNFPHLWDQSEAGDSALAEEATMVYGE